jgi:diaminopimelate decarboxylase
VQDVAGPACLSGDLLAVGRALPPPEQGGHAVAPDPGAYGFARHYACAPLVRPGIHGYAPDRYGSMTFAPVRRARTATEAMADSGGAHAPALTTLRAPESR